MQISNNEIKLINSLKLKKFRQLHHLFIAETPKLIEDLISSGFDIHKIFASTDWMIPQNINPQNVVEVNERQLKKISSLKTPHQVLALVKIPKEEDITYFHGCTLVLDGIQNPGNLGTIIRSADWFGIKNIICSEDTVDVFSPKVVQASMGSLTRVKVHYKNLHQFFINKKDEHAILGTDMKGASIYDILFPENFYLIIGNEGKGISADISSFISKNISIPNFSHSKQKAESLNAAVAASILISYIKGSAF